MTHVLKTILRDNQELTLPSILRMMKDQPETIAYENVSLGDLPKNVQQYAIEELDNTLNYPLYYQ